MDAGVEVRNLANALCDHPGQRGEEGVELGIGTALTHLAEEARSEVPGYRAARWQAQAGAVDIADLEVHITGVAPGGHGHSRVPIPDTKSCEQLAKAPIGAATHRRATDALEVAVAAHLDNADTSADVYEQIRKECARARLHVSPRHGLLRTADIHFINFVDFVFPGEPGKAPDHDSELIHGYQLHSQLIMEKLLISVATAAGRRHLLHLFMQVAFLEKSHRILHAISRPGHKVDSALQTTIIVGQLRVMSTFIAIPLIPGDELGRARSQVAFEKGHPHKTASKVQAEELAIAKGIAVSTSIGVRRGTRPQDTLRTVQ